MNNHPRLTCKHFYKHQSESAQHRCTLRGAFHAPFHCPRAQCNGGCGKPDWARIEYKLAKQEAREPDLRWGQDAVQPPPPPAEALSQEGQPQEDPAADQQPMCAATAMMHGIQVVQLVPGNLQLALRSMSIVHGHLQQWKKK